MWSPVMAELYYFAMFCIGAASALAVFRGW
jgi:hypothetical protein